MNAGIGLVLDKDIGMDVERMLTALYFLVVVLTYFRSYLHLLA